jgi:hypothetical protein
VDRREKSRANREQLRCCNWIRLPKANPQKHSGVKAGRRCVRRVPDGKPGARIFDRSTSFASVTLDPILKRLGSRYRCKTDSGVCQSGSDREKTSSQKEE